MLKSIIIIIAYCTNRMSRKPGTNSFFVKLIKHFPWKPNHSVGKRNIQFVPKASNRKSTTRKESEKEISSLLKKKVYFKKYQHLCSLAHAP